MQLGPVFASVVGKVSVAALRGARKQCILEADPLMIAMDIYDQPWVVPARMT